MKRAKKLYILLGVLVAACVITFAATRIEQRREDIKNSDEIILQIPIDSVQSLSWDYEDSFSFHKNEAWLYDADEEFPVDADAIDKLLSVFEEFGASFVIENVEDYGQYGLDDPICTIEVGANEQVVQIQLGNFSNMDSQRYVSVGDGNVYLVSYDPLDEYGAVLSDLIDHDEIPYFSDITSISFEGNGENYEILYEEESKNTYCSDDVYFAQINGKSLPLDTSSVQSYTSGIRSLGLTNYVNYKVTEAELANYGLDSPELTVTIYYDHDVDGETASDSFVIHLSRNREEVAEAEETTKEDDASDEYVTAYARIGDSRIIYELTSTQYNSLIAMAYNDLRHRDVMTVDFEKVYQMDIALEGSKYTLTSEENEDEDSRTWFYQDEELSITDLKLAIEDATVAEFSTEAPTGKEEISLTLLLNDDNFAEATVAFYRYDGTNCLAVIDGTPLALVARSYVVDLIEAVNAIVLN